MVHRAEYLVVDTTAFIQNANLQDIGNNIISLSDVVDEVKSKRQLRRLVVLPYDLQIKDVFPEYVKFVTEFSKKTGDFISLSTTDLKVIALTYQLEKQFCGTDHLKSAPVVPRSVTFDAPRLSGVSPTHTAGFYKGHSKKKVNNKDGTIDEVDDNEKDIECNIQTSEEKNDNSDENEDNRTQTEELKKEHINNVNKGNITVKENKGQLHEDDDKMRCFTDSVVDDAYKDLSEQISSLNFDENSDSLVDQLLVRITDKENSTDVGNSGDDDDDDDDDEYYSANEDYYDNKDGDGDSDDDGGGDDDDDGGDWITPHNIKEVKKQLNADMLEEKPIVVGCITTDFAMQNVLKQIGLNVVTLDGRVIKQLRTFILRCYCCFKTTSIMTKIFCPHCGNKSLKRVAVTLDENGQQKIHINPRVRITARGKKFSLPRPKGGQHAVNPILCEDQPVPQQRATQLAYTKNNPLDPDYIAGFSPFVMRDVNSRSAVLGVGNKNQTVKYWMRKNPNEVQKKKRNKRK